VSRAFVTERDGDTGDDLPDLPFSPHPNYVTSAGLGTLVRRSDALKAERAELVARPDEPAARMRLKTVERELRWLGARIGRAIVVDLSRQPRDEVRFGATVTVADEDAVLRRFTIVGEDEAEPDAGRVSWVSPLARVLIGARVGDDVVWRRPGGEAELVVMAIDYLPEPSEPG